MKIGLTYTGSMAKHQNYVNWLKGGTTGEQIEVLSLSTGEDNFKEISQCDGLVLSGGVDIDPSFYQGKPGYAKAPLSGWQSERDRFEQHLFLFAMEHHLPVLGVCRGLQMINVSLNGDLVQDLGERGDEIHENSKEDKMHAVLMEEGSLLYSITAEKRGTVNSAHHQAIGKLGEGLRINSRSEDGVIEGIEWENADGRPFMLAVQWHPERMFVNGLADTFLYHAIRDRFIAETGNVRGKKLK